MMKMESGEREAESGRQNELCVMNSEILRDGPVEPKETGMAASQELAG